MRIQSKKTKLVQVITKDQWKELKKRQISRNFVVLDHEDDPTDTIEIPRQEIEMAEATKEIENQQPSVEEMKNYLRDQGVSFHHNLGEKKLRKLYEEHLIF